MTYIEYKFNHNKDLILLVIQNTAFKSYLFQLSLWLVTILIYKSFWLSFKKSNVANNK